MIMSTRNQLATNKEISMKKTILALSAVVALSLSACSTAEAAEFSLGYQDNTVVGQEGVVASVATEVDGVRLGLTTFTSDGRLESYGGYAGIPIKVQGTKFTFTPQAEVSQYRDESELVGGLGLGVEYALTETTRVDAVAMAHEGFDNSNFDGETYTVGLTKVF